jgi:hypothetical protein
MMLMTRRWQLWHSSELPFEICYYEMQSDDAGCGGDAAVVDDDDDDDVFACCD